MSYSLIIFDCDGVLVDSEPLATAVMAEMARDVGLEIDKGKALKRFKGRKIEECVAEIEYELGRPIPEEFVTEFRRRSAEKFRACLSAIPGIKSVLERLSVPYCLASSAPISKIHLTLTITDLLEYFEGNIFSGYEIGSWKPEPFLFLHAASAYGVPPRQCAVIEDSDTGVQAGLAAGMHVFHYNPSQKTTVNTKNALVSFNSMDHLLDLLQP